MVVWQAKLDGEDAEHADDKTLDEMCERLDDFWEQLKDELLYA